MADPILSLVDVHAGYDGVPVVFGVSLEVMPGEMVAVVGANGAGKSTTLRAVAGLNNPLQGTIRFEGRDISRLPSPWASATCPRGGDCSRSSQSRRTCGSAPTRSNRRPRSGGASTR